MNNKAIFCPTVKRMDISGYVLTEELHWQTWSFSDWSGKSITDM